ncbi:MAG: ABC transporter substrate-binding protein [Nitriliruptorales bacterium]
MRIVRSTWLAVATALLLLASACASDTTTETDTGDTGGQAGDTGGDDAQDTGEAAGTTTLSIVITWSGSEGEAFQAVIDRFEESHADIDVEVIQVPFGDLNAQLTQQFSAGDPPDVATVFPGLVRLFAGQGFLLPIDDLYEEWLADGSYTESLRDVGSADGTAYGAWFKGNVNGLIWYRPDELEALGVSVPESWDDFTAALDASEQAGQDAITVGGADGWPLTQWSDAVLARVAGPDAFLGLQQGSVSWDDPRVVEAFEVFAGIIGDHFPATALDRGFVDSTCALVDGSATFQNQGAFISLVAPGECDSSLTLGEDLNFFRLPDHDASVGTAEFISGDLFAIAKDTPNPDAAKELVRYLGSAEAQEIWAARGGFVAPNGNVSADVYPTDVDRAAAALFPTDPSVVALYDLDDFIGGEIQTVEREALQTLVRDQDVEGFIATMVEVDERVRGG